jgi:hypothetical protein
MARVVLFVKKAIRVLTFTLSREYDMFLPDDLVKSPDAALYRIFGHSGVLLNAHFSGHPRLACELFANGS